MYVCKGTRITTWEIRGRQVNGDWGVLDSLAPFRKREERTNRSNTLYQLIEVTTRWIILIAV